MSATAHIDGRQRLGDLREGHWPDLTLYNPLEVGHVLVASDSVGQGFERRVDKRAAPVIRQNSSPSRMPTGRTCSGSSTTQVLSFSRPRASRCIRSTFSGVSLAM